MLDKSELNQPVATKAVASNTRIGWLAQEAQPGRIFYKQMADSSHTVVGTCHADPD